MVDGAAGSGEFAASEFSARLARSLGAFEFDVPNSTLLRILLARDSYLHLLLLPSRPSSHHRHVPTPKDVCVMSACNFEFESLLLIGFDPEFKIGICESEPFAIMKS